MVRNGIIIAILLGATFFLPISVQLALYGLSVFVLRGAVWMLLIPAIVADAWYASEATFSLQGHLMVLIALGIIIIYSLVVRKTRITHRYGVPKN